MLSRIACFMTASLVLLGGSKKPVRRAGGRRIGSGFQPLEPRRLLAGDVLQLDVLPEGEDVSPPYATGVIFYDANGDGDHTPADELVKINNLNHKAAVGGSFVFNPFETGLWTDTNGDGFDSPIDVLMGINRLNDVGAGPAPQPPLTNLPPQGQDLLIETPEQTSIVFVAPFLDPELMPMNFDVTDGPFHGSLTQSGSMFQYTPEYGFYYNMDAVVLEATDSAGHTATARVNIQVSFDSSQPHPPQAVDDSVEIYVGETIDVFALQNDVSYGGPLTIVDCTQPIYGTTSIAGGHITYDPAPNFFGQDSFDYTVRDTNGLEDTATVTVVVEENLAPFPANPSYSISANASVSFAVTALGSDIEGHTFEVTDLGTPQYGLVTGTGPWTYAPNLDFTGTDSFSYELTDELGAVSSGVVMVHVYPDLFNSAYMTRSEAVYSIVEVYAGGVLYDHTGTQTYGDVPSGHWAWAHWEEIVSEDWHSSGFAVGANAYPDEPVSYGELVLLGEIVTGRPYAGGIHLGTAESLCWITESEANSPASSVPTDRALEILYAMDHETACSLTPQDYADGVDAILSLLGQ